MRVPNRAVSQNRQNTLVFKALFENVDESKMVQCRFPTASATALT